jgi:penicillin-binding protein-related factor A (putative recombinase)
MLIVRPPKEITQKTIESNNKSGSALDFSGLDQNALDVKVFKDPYANFNELSVNELDINYLTNALDNFMLASFVVGYNATNQVYIFDKSTYYQVQRSVKQSATILINKDRGYLINLVQDGTTVQLQSQDSTTNTINIKQGSK